jgi:glycosyltransferase involved in cell wall biosynthesis
MDCTTILLIYNEEGNIKPLTKDIRKVYKKEKIDGEVLLVDDGSEDNSGKICDKLAEKYENVRVIHHSPNRGRSYAIQTGFREGKGKVHIIMDGDYQYEPKEIPAFLKKIDEGFDVVTGFRASRADTPIRRFISRVYNRWIIQRRF